MHANANFGDTPKREVVNLAVLKAAFGYGNGHTAECILVEHGLLRRPRVGRNERKLTAKGMKYLRALFRDVSLSDVLKVREQ